MKKKPLMFAFFALLLFFVSRLWILSWPPLITDVGLYYELSMRSAWTSFKIYRDFPYAYPLLGWYAIKWPALSSPELSFKDYRETFRLFLFSLEAVFVVGIFVHAWFKKQNLVFLAKALSVYVIATTLLGNLLYDRIDLLMTFTLVFIFATWNAQRGSAWKLGGSFFAGFMVKLVPIGLWPFKFLEFWRRDRRRALISIWMPAVCLFSLVIAENTLYPGLLKPLGDHGKRGVQVESLWALPFYFQKMTDLDPYVRITTVGGADEIDPHIIPDWYHFLSHYLGFSVIAFMGFLFWRRKMNLNDPAFRSDFFLLFLFAFLTWQRVLSPQFLIWTCPFLAMSLVYRWDLVLALLSLGCFGLTYVNFSDLYWHLIQFEPVPVFLLAARDLFILAIFAVLWRRVFGRRPID